MRLLLSFTLVLFCTFGISQVRPDNFPVVASPDSSNFEVYSQKGGLSRRANLYDLKEYFAPGINLTPLGSNLTDGDTIASNFMSFVEDSEGETFYVDKDGIVKRVSANPASAFNVNDTTTSSATYSVSFSDAQEARVVVDLAATGSSATIELPAPDSNLGKKATIKQINPTGGYSTQVTVNAIGNRVRLPGQSALTNVVNIPAGTENEYVFIPAYDDNSATYVWKVNEPDVVYSESDGLKFFDPIASQEQRVISETDFSTFNYIDADVSGATVLSALASRKSPDFILVLGDTVTVNKSLTLPKASEVGDGVNLTIFADYENPFFYYQIQSSSPDVILVSNTLNKNTNKYTLSTKEKVTLKTSNGVWHLETSVQREPELYSDEFLFNTKSPGETIKYKSGAYKITTSLPSGFTEPDGTFVIPLINRVPYGQNTVYHSDNLVSATTNVKNWRLNIDSDFFGLTPWYELNGEIGPDGKKTAEVFYAPLDFTTLTLNQSNSLTDLNEGDTVTVSYWAKSYNTDLYLDRVNIGITAPPFTSVFAVNEDNYLSTEWKRYEHTGVISGVSGNIGTYNLSFSFKRNLTNTDTLLFAMVGVQLEKTGAASYYKPTTSTNIIQATSDTVYAQLMPDNNILDITDVYRGTSSDALFLKRAIDYFEKSGTFGEILIPDLTIDTALYSDTIAIGLPEFLTLRGAKYTSSNVSANATITANLNDTTITLIDYLADAPNTYADKQNLINLNIATASPIKRLVNRNSAETSFIENCFIDGNNLAKEGVRTGKSGRGSLFTYIINSSVTSCDYNILYEFCGNEHMMEKVKFGQSNIASLWINGVPNLTIRDSDSEDNSGYIMQVNNIERFLEIDNCYFEHSTSPPLLITNVNNFIMRNSVWGAFTTFSFSSTVKNLTFVNNLFNSSPIFQPESSVTAFGNTFSSSNSASIWGSLMSNSVNKFAINSIVKASAIGENDVVNYFSSGIGSRNRFDSTYVSGYIGDTIALNNVYLKGIHQNLHTYSDSLGSVKSGLESVFSISDTIIDGVEYDMLISNYDTTFSSGSPILIPSGIRTFNTGEVVTFSFEYKYLNTPEIVSPTQFTFRYVKLPDFQSFQVPMWATSEWRVVQKTVTILNDDVRLSLESAVFNAGDTIIFRNFQINTGTIRLAHIPTTGTAIENTNLGLILDTSLVISNGVEDVLSVVADSSTLRLPQYGAGTKDETTLGKTTSNYQAVFATDGTLIEQDMRLSRAEVYVDYLDPDTVTVVSAGSLYSASDVTENVAVNFTTSSSGRLTYTGTKTIDVQIMWTATVTSNGTNENLIGTVLDNNTSLTRIRWEEEDAAASDRHSVSAHGTFTMSTNDWIEPKFTSESNGTVIEIISMCFSAEEKQ